MTTTCRCIVCEKAIKELSAKSKGEDGIFCEGICQGWIHRQCAGIPKPVFAALRSSPEPFLCTYCPNTKITALKESIEALKTEVSSLKSQLSSSSNASYASIVGLPSETSAMSQPPQLNPAPTVSAVKKSLVFDNATRKFNFVIYSIEKKPKGSPHHSRLTENNNDVADVIRKLDDSIPSHSISDSIRLGKFSEDRCRPILVKMSHSCEVLSILANHLKLMDSPGIIIKPDVSYT